MKVILLNPPNINKKSYIARSADRWPHAVPVGKFFKARIFPKYPIYLMYAAAVLEKGGFDVTVIDAAVKNYSIKETSDMIFKLKPGLVVIETSAPSRIIDLKTAESIYKKCQCHIVLIGPHATVFAEELLKENPFIDSVARGEYFYILLDLAKAINKKRKLDKINGLSFRQGEKIKSNPDRPIVQDIDTLPYPARHLLDPKDYLMGHYTYDPQLLMVTSIGCPFHCIFCLWPKTLYQRTVRLRDPKKVVGEMKYLVENYGAKEIYFDDDFFNLTEKRVIEVCDAIIKSGIKLPWIAEMRVTPLSEKMLKKMKKAGCIKILYGVESGSQEILNNAKKGTTIEQIKKAFKLTHKEGIKTHAAYMFGLPGETKETIEQTIKFAKELDSDTIQCSLALPYPGTEFYEIAKKNRSLKVKRWADFDGEMGGVIEYPGLLKKYLRDSMSRMYKEFYVRPRHLTKRILGIRSVADIKRFLELIKGYFRRFSVE